MRNVRQPSKFTKLLAKTTKYHGIDLAFFHPEDIDINQKTIKAKILMNNEWVQKEIAVPLFVDVTAYSFKFKKQIRFLRKYSHFTAGRSIAKHKFQEKIRDDGEFADLLIPTVTHSNFNSLFKFLKEHKQVIAKPNKGQKGEGIYKVSKIKSNYFLSYKEDEKQISKRALKKFSKEVLDQKPYVYQKYIDSTTISGDPFDCRIRLEKNGKGEWEVVKYLMRIGTGQKVVSNVVQGGSVSEMTPFLKYNYANNWKSIKESLIKLGNTFPYKIEELCQQNLSSLGIDIGIDKAGHLYLFEVNHAPGTEFGEGAIAMVKSDYYKYMLDKLS